MDPELIAIILKLLDTEAFKLPSKGYNKVRAKITNACHKYDKEYRDRHGELKAYCTGMREPIPLDKVYVEIQFLDQHTLPRYGSSEEVEQAFLERGERHFDSSSGKRQDGIQVANEKQHLMLLGDPGVGKSTFLRKVGLEALKGKKGEFKHKCLPVFLELKSFKKNQIDIEALIAHELKICGYPNPEQMTNAALESGKLLILFDGLDEVPASNVDNVIHEIGDFVDQYNQNRFIASCRIAAYSGGLRRFTDVEMAAFDDTHIKAYIEKWFKSTPNRDQHPLDEQVKIADQCWKTLSANGHSATKELARNPLLLTLLCMAYNRWQNFPRNRAALYEDALNIFLKAWAAEKRVNRGASITQYLDLADEKRMLSEIAAKNFDENHLFFTKDELITQIREFDAREMFNASEILETILIQGLFVERVRGSYSFSHLTFQEYLTANYIVGNPQSIQSLVNQHLHDPQWREVFLLTAGLMCEADDLLVAMEAEAAKSINTDGIKLLLQWANRKTDTTDNQYRRIVKRLSILRQFFSLWLLNKIYEVFGSGNVVNHALDLALNLDFASALDRDLNQDLDRYQDLALDQGLDLDRDLYRNLDRDRYQDLDRDLARALNLDLYLYRDRDVARALALDLYLYLYQDSSKYMDTDFYRSVTSQSRHQFDEQLQEQLQKQIKFVKCMKEMKIFKEVDLQRMVQRFNAQREYIKAAAEGRSLEPPAASIHDTWLSVLGITDDMLAIPREALKSYVTYLEAVELIVACKEAARRVSPKVWQQIENRFLTPDAADIRN